MPKNTKKPDKTRRKNSARELRDSLIQARVIAGEKQQDIAREIGLSPQTVSEILNSDDQKKTIKQAQMKVLAMMDLALETLRDAMTDRYSDMPSALKASLSVLKNYGVIREKVDLQHHFPKPTIIERLDGSQVILTAKSDEDKD
jgi:DNA-binding XRE family transcriptional regulator